MRMKGDGERKSKRSTSALLINISGISYHAVAGLPVYTDDLPQYSLFIKK